VSPSVYPDDGNGVAVPGVHPAGALGFERVVFFSDAVFAIAITLLALDVRLPPVENSGGEAVARAMVGLLPQIGAYVLSFVVIGQFWVGHHRLFRLVAGYDYRLVWLNLVFLLSIAFLPVPTRIIAEHGDTAPGTIFYAVCLCAVGGLEFLVWWYVARERRLVAPTVSPDLVRYIELRILTVPVVFALSVPITLVSPALGKLTWALIWVVMVAFGRLYPRAHRERG
jgi:uncharacterized membrane protein